MLQPKYQCKGSVYRDTSPGCASSGARAPHARGCAHGEGASTSGHYPQVTCEFDGPNRTRESLPEFGALTYPLDPTRRMLAGPNAAKSKKQSTSLQNPVSANAWTRAVPGANFP